MGKAKGSTNTANNDANTDLAGVTWFYVKHGEAQKTLFNSDCWALTLMDTVKEVAAVAPDKVCDLQDGETGTLLGIPTQEARLNAATLVKPTRSYVLVAPQYATDGPTAGAVIGIETLYTPPAGENLPPPPPAPDAKKKK
ncbi:hypothetical protein KFE25_002001 [Diacronema lutheri]|uniref:Uncharacterized protein n=1 Tax=Diacronema lutheri TaxID=2081491 RepID=A0A8J5XQW9_DIALT|nr:hypothetical protein KFE25_002001 [Diacronema lutheri]